MRRFVLVGLILMALGFPAWSGGSTEAESERSVVELHMLAEQDVIALVEDIIDRFEAENPDIRVELVTREVEAYKTAIQVAVGSGDAPDIFFVWSGEYTGKFVREGRLLDLTSAVADDWGNEFISATLDPFTLGGSVWAIPYSLESKFLYYNTDHFSSLGLQPPETWEDLYSVAEVLRGAGYIPLTAGGSLGWQLAHYISLLNQKLLGTEEILRDYNLDREPGELFAAPEYVQAIQMLVDLKNDGVFGPNVEALAYEVAQAQFFSGQASMFYGGTWTMAIWNGANGLAPPEFAGQYAMTSLPAVEGGAGDQGVILGAPIGLAVSADSDVQEEAIRFLRFFTSEENQRRVVSDLNRLPATRGSVPADAPANIRQVSASLEEATGMVGWLDTVVEISISNVYLNGLVGALNGSMSPEAVMAAVRERAIEVQGEIGRISY